MELLLISFIAGVLTVLAPCILPVLPIIIGGSLADTGNERRLNIIRPLVVTMSLGLSIVVFTVLLKATTAFITIPDAFWKWFSATIIFAFALSLLFPRVWAKIQAVLPFGGGLKNLANKSIATHRNNESLLGAFFIGIALGPVFAACSPTFFLLLGTVLPASFGVGLLNLIVFAFGLSLMLLLVAFAGQKVLHMMNIAANPNGWFKKVLGLLFLLVAFGIVTGTDKKIESKLIDKGYGVTNIEKKLLQEYTNKDINNQNTTMKDTTRAITDTKNVRVTEVSGTQLPIPEVEILAGGPPKDGIPPIDNPEFILSSEVNYLNPSDEGVGIVDEAGVATFYPFRVLVWHEIVNTQIAHQGIDDFPVSITYCPLCKTAIAFEGLIDGVPTTFGTSGKLWQSNLLMYDRNADESQESLWSQVLGTAVHGPATGTKLAIYPSTITTFDKWQEAHAETRVLSKKTGHFRNYSTSPYGGYDESREVYFPTNFSDTETHPKTVVLGLEIDGNDIAYEKDKIEVGEKEDVFAGKFITIKRTSGDTITFTIDGEQVPFIEGFWFSWQAVHPASELR